MLSFDDGDIDVFFDSVDSLSGEDSLLANEEFGSERCGSDYDEIWVKEPVSSVKERRERFLQGMGFAYAPSKVEEKMNSGDASINLGLERMKHSNACILPNNKASEKLVLSGCKTASGAKVLLDEMKGVSPQDEVDANFQGKVNEFCSALEENRHIETEAHEEFSDFDMGRKKRKNWWKRFVNMRKGDEGIYRSKLNSATNKICRIKVMQNKKKWLEFSGLYIGQEIKAHKGLIWTMKFSYKGEYLASGGEDGVVRIWHVISLHSSCICFAKEDGIASNKVKHDKSFPWKKHSSPSFIFLPNSIFQIKESPLHEFCGHSSDVLDLAWSNSNVNILLSSSMDKTVRMWQIGSNQCLNIFHHNDYVTCIQFNPVDENYFISGSIDGKVRIWGIREARVIDWANVRDVISAISYQHDGKGFVVGSVTGTCRFYVASGKYFQLEAQLDLQGKKKASGNMITGIQISQTDCQRIMITSEDSKIRIFDGIELVQKFRGLPKSGSQMSCSFTSSGKHIISVGEDSHVYIWNLNEMKNASCRPAKPECSCEYFFSEGVTVAIPWSGMKAYQRGPSSQLSHRETRDSERFSLGNWFSIEATCRGSMTWPEEKLPRWGLALAEDDYDHTSVVSETWELSIVAAGSDGTIKTFHNFGLPIRH